MRGYAEFERVAREQQQRGGCVFVYFSGDKDPDTGISWCPDCVKGGWRGQACFSAGWRHVHVGIGRRDGCPGSQTERSFQAST